MGCTLRRAKKLVNMVAGKVDISCCSTSEILASDAVPSQMLSAYREIHHYFIHLMIKIQRHFQLRHGASSY